MGISSIAKKAVDTVKSKAGTIGTVIGGIYGGPTGAAAGGAIGNTLSGQKSETFSASSLSKLGDILGGDKSSSFNLAESISALGLKDSSSNTGDSGKMEIAKLLFAKIFSSASS